jgi:glycine cleavage system regulatory protein
MSEDEILVQLTSLHAEMLTAIGALRDRIEAIDAKQGQLLEEAVRTRSDVMARIDRVQDSITQLRNEMVVNFGSAELPSWVIRNHGSSPVRSEN